MPAACHVRIPPPLGNRPLTYRTRTALGGAQTCLPLCTNPLDQAARPATTPLDTYDAGNLPPVNLAQVDAQTTVVQMPLGLAGNYTFRSNLANAMCQQEPVNVTGK